MRRLDLDKFSPQSRASYFLHLAASDGATAVALCVCSVSTGAHPCRGIDADEGDGYTGDILRNNEGIPLEHVLVRYFGERDGHRIVAGETYTDKIGRHVLPLPPGHYDYVYLDQRTPMAGMGAALQLAEGGHVDVMPGHSVSWEDPDRIGVNNLSQTPDTIERPVSFVTEEWLADWHSEDGRPWAWLDVEETIKEVCGRITQYQSTLRRVGFSATGAKFPRPDLIASLRRVGLPASDLAMSPARLAVAFRNMQGLGKARYMKLLGDERGNYALLGVRPSRTSVTAEPGVPLYLAEARYVCVSEAAQIAGQNASGKLTVFNPREAQMRSKRRMPFMGGVVVETDDGRGGMKRVEKGRK